MTGALPRVRPTFAVRDVGLAAVVAFAVLQMTHWISEPGTRAVDAPAYAIGAAAALSLLGWRRRPVVVLGATIILQVAYQALNYPGPGPFLALLAAVTLTAVAGRRRAALLGAAVAAVLVTALHVAGGQELLEASVVMPVVLLGGAVLLGEAMASRKAYLAEVSDRLARTESEREREAERRVTEERLRIARDLHDVMGHTLAVVSVHAGLAADTIDSHPHQARAAVSTIREAARDALSELRTIVEVMRHPAGSDAPTAPAPGLGAVEDLVATATSGGLQVRLTIPPERPRLSPVVDLTAYRIVQEALTNVLRHAGATSAEVVIAFNARTVEITVDDDGRGMRNAPVVGHGIAGMRERAAAIGGSVDVAARPGGGVRVRAVLPTTGGRP